MSNLFLNESKEYEHILFNTEVGAPGRAYLKKRGISAETAKYWNMGYCPYNYIAKVYKDTGKKPKKMFGRVTFPIIDQSGKFVSISGRLVLQLKNASKYDHYPFQARRILFGLYQNKEDIRQIGRAAVTEGQIDVITSWQAGFRIATSSFGAHGSLDHLALLSRYAKIVDILYDADKAGIQGEKQIKELSTMGDLDIRFQKPFNQGEDLDSWITKNDVTKLWSLLDKSKEADLLAKIQQMRR